MIEIKMNSSAAGPLGNFLEGKSYVVDNNLAESFVGGGYASYTKAIIQNPRPPIPVMEKAVIAPEEVRLVIEAPSVEPPVQVVTKVSVPAPVKTSATPWVKK